MGNSDTKKGLMRQTDLVVVVYNSLMDAEAAIEELQRSGFNMKKLSIIDQCSGKSCDRWGHQFVGIYNLGIPKKSILRYESALEANKFIVIVQGTEEEVAKSREEISRTNPDSIDVHKVSPAMD